MRNNTVVNHENKNLFNNILRHASKIYGDKNPYMVAKFIGILLVLKKNGIKLEDIDFNNPHLALTNMNNTTISNDMASLSSEIIEEVMKITQIKEVEHIINFLAMSQFSEGEYLRWYDYCLEELSTKNKKLAQFYTRFEKDPAGNYYKNKTLAEFYTPKTFATLVDAFLPSETVSIFNPFGGLMRFATDIEHFHTMEACERQHDAWMIGMMRLELSGKTDKVSYNNRNVDSWTYKHYDAIVAMPQFNAKIQMLQSSQFVSNNSSEEYEDVAISRFVDSTTSNGCCITFVSPSILWKLGEKARLREWATKNRYIDTIILLPNNLLKYTSIPVVCLILRKETYHKDGVRMIDASNFFTKHQYKYNLSIDEIMNAYHQDTEKVSATISFEQIAENDFSWNVTDYLNLQKVECPQGYTLVSIKDIIRFPKVQRSTDIISGNIVQISNLSDDWTQPYVDVESIEKKDVLCGCTMVTENAILISTIRNLKASIVKASVDKPIFVNQNILVAIPNDGVDAEYLCMVLAKTEIPTIGTGAPYITKTRLLRQKIALPGLEQQRSTYKEARHAAMLEKMKSLHLEEVLDRRIAEYSNEIRSRKHDMKPHLRQLSCACKNLEFYLSHPDNFSEEEFMAGMKEEVANQKSAIESLTTLLKIFSREEKFGTPEIINIDEYLLNHYTDGINYEIDYDTDYQALADYGFEIHDELRFPSYSIVNGKFEFKSIEKDFVEGANVFIAKDDLQRLFDNIINNAIQHGFTDSNRSNYNITINLSVNSKLGMFQIDVTNNGNPLPKGINKMRYGLKGEKAGNTAGTGEGGYIVKSIVEHYKGDFDIFSVETDKSVLTTIRILLPIYRTDE